MGGGRRLPCYFAQYIFKSRAILTFIANNKGFSSSFMSALTVTFRLISSNSSHSQETFCNSDHFLGRARANE